MNHFPYYTFLTFLFLLPFGGWSQNSLTSDTIKASKDFKAGLKYDEAGNYDSAIFFLRKAADLYKKHHLIEKTINVQNKWSFDMCMKGEIDNALKLLDQNLALCNRYMKLGSMPFADTYHGYGVAKYSAGLYQEAIDNFKKSLKLKRKWLGEVDQKIASTINNLGILYETLEHLDSAKIYYLQNLELSVKLHGIESRDVANAYNNLGGNAYYKGDYQSATEYYNKSLEIYKKVLNENHPELSSSYLNIAVILIETGEYEKALDYTMHAAKIVRTNYGEESPQYLNVLLNLGTLYAHMKNLDKGLEYSLQGFETGKKIFGPDHPSLGKLSMNIGTIYHDLGNYNKSLEWQTRSMEINAKLQGAESFDVASNCNNLANSYLRLKKYGEAERFILRAIAIKKKTLGLHHESLAFSFANLTDIYFTQKKFEPALNAAQRGLIANHFVFADTSVNTIPPFNNFSSVNTFSDLLIAKATCLLSLFYDKKEPEFLRQGLLQLLAADSLLSKRQRELENESELIFISSDLKRISVLAVTTCAELYKLDKDKRLLDKIIYFKDRSRSSALMLAISHAQADRSSELATETKGKLMDLQKKSSVCQLALAQLLENGAKESEAQVADLREQLFTIGQEYSLVKQKIESENPKYYELKYRIKTASASDIQRKFLSQFPRTAIIQYTLLDSALSIAILTSNDILVYDSVTPINVEKDIKALRNSIVFKQDEETKLFSQKLYEALWKPVERLFTKTNSAIDHIIIVPDGILTYLPFEVLFPQTKTNRWKDAPFLIKKYDISYSISATHLLDNFLAPVNYGKDDFVAFAPVFTKESQTNFLVNTTERSGTNENNNSPLRAALKSGNIEQIPFSEEEVKKICELYKKKNLFAESFLFKEAKEATIKREDMRHFKYIHLATHGIVDDDFPELSALLLSQDTTNAEDGILYAKEIYGLEWNADLVTLSACETGLGKIADGEGILGLTRGFMYAGVRNLLVSLWRVSDASTSNLMIEFYNQLLTGKSKAQSLRIAKTKLIHSKKFSNPYYWAPFVLIGN